MEDKNNSGKRSRRSMMKLAAAAGASAAALPGLAAADNSEANNAEVTSKAAQRARQRKAAERGFDWNEDWLDHGRMDESWASLEAQVSPDDRDTRHIGGEIGVKGITVTIEATFGDCEGEITVGALGQTRTLSVSCSDACVSQRIDGGAAYVDVDFCYNWDTHTLSATVEGCVWHLTGWSCAEESESLSA